MIQKNRPVVKTILWKTILGMGMERNQQSNEPFSVDEYEKAIAPLRLALRKEAEKTAADTYGELTLRQFATLWEQAFGERQWSSSLEELEHRYDLDSAEDFFNWSSHIDHSCDLLYARVTFYPECANWIEAAQKKGEGARWQLVLMGHPGDATSLALYALRLQKAGVHFVLRDAKEVLQEFNSSVGYRKRSLKQEDKG